jgi:hypothetical protein
MSNSKRPPASSDPEWYMVSTPAGRKFGNLKVHTAAAILYLAVALFPLGHFLLLGCEVPDWVKQKPWWVGL